MKNETARARISVIVGELEATKAALGPLYVADPSDREAYDILSRIERRIGRGSKPGAAA
jgi:hypothetical protein